MRTLYPYVHDITVYVGLPRRGIRSSATLSSSTAPTHSPGADRAWTEQRLNRGLRVVWVFDRANLQSWRSVWGRCGSARSVQFWIPTLDDGLWTAAVVGGHFAASSGAESRGNQYAGEGSGSGGSWDISRRSGRGTMRGPWPRFGGRAGPAGRRRGGAAGRVDGAAAGAWAGTVQPSVSSLGS